MTKSGTSTLEPFDPEIKRTFRRIRKLVEARVSPKRERPIMEETPAPVGVVGVENPRTLMEYAQPSIEGTASCIRRPEIQANRFELKPFYVNMIQNLIQFHDCPLKILISI